ncbi:MAG: hypothetical protein V3T84_04170, partial [Phycisphaerales bacterium]
LPLGPLVVMIHMASVWVPFTSESKEAIADYDEIRKEMKLALQECGRKLGTYLRRRKRMQRESERRSIFERYIGEVAKSCQKITGTDADKLYKALVKQAARWTAEADQRLDEEGRVLDETARLARDEQVVVVPSQQADLTNRDQDIGDSLFEDSPKPKARKTTKRSKKKASAKRRSSKRK